MKHQDMGKWKTLLLVRGVPGAGKTTLAQLIAAFSMDDKVEINCNDDYMCDAEGNYAFDWRLLGGCAELCLLATKNDMEDLIPFVVVHNTFTTDKELAPYFALAEKYGYRAVSVIVENRHNNTSVHNVPEGTIEKMKKRFSIQL